MATLLKLTLLDLLLAMVNMMLRSWWLKLLGVVLAERNKESCCCEGELTAIAGVKSLRDGVAPYG
ncbi:hypothetical protein NC651_002045 [Populus alba x Populus x berolinensis]|nr:hypothetical protein NC651_002045 [Populus alba x Populus x berolinensis]